MHNISINELLKMNNANIIDIRNGHIYSIGHIPNSINIPERELINNSDKYLNYDNKYYIYCQSGVRSSYVVKLLSSMGFNCVNINGGYNNYLLRN